MLVVLLVSPEGGFNMQVELHKYTVNERTICVSFCINILCQTFMQYQIF